MQFRNYFKRHLKNQTQGPLQKSAQGFLQRPLQRFFQKQWISWLKRTMPVLDEVRLHRRNIFIFPSKFGGGFSILIILLFVLGVNYQNNLVIILSYFCFSLFITTMLLCYQNMSGILIRPKAHREYVADQLISMQCQLSSDDTKQGLRLNYRDEPVADVSSLPGQRDVALTLNQRQRGTNRLPRLIIASEYPLGLFRAWTNLEFEQDIVVFPASVPYVEKLTAIEQGNGAYTSRRTVSGDSFSGLEPFRAGESLKRVAWKQLAQGKGMLTKQFEQTLGEPQWLDINDIEAVDIEQSLSHLAYLVNHFSSKNQPFGLRLKHQVLPVDQGNLHRHAALTLLANYGGGHE